MVNFERSAAVTARLVKTPRSSRRALRNVCHGDHKRLPLRKHSQQASGRDEDNRTQHEADEAEGGGATEQAEKDYKAAGRGAPGKEQWPEDVVGQAYGKDTDDHQNDPSPDIPRQQEPQCRGHPHERGSDEWDQ